MSEFTLGQAIRGARVKHIRKADLERWGAGVMALESELALGPDVSNEPSCPSCGRLRYCDLNKCGWYPQPVAEEQEDV